MSSYDKPEKNLRVMIACARSEPIIGAQAVDILSGGQGDTQPARVLRIATDGLRPFALQTAELP